LLADQAGHLLVQQRLGRRGTVEPSWSIWLVIWDASPPIRKGGMAR
jgi:hypothetical protein